MTTPITTTEPTAGTAGRGRALGLGLFALAALAATPALAHTGHGDTFSPLEGFLHPITGPDHLVAMLCVGLWSALAGGRSVLWWPLAFVAAMVVGAVVAHDAVEVPAVEMVITGSLIAVGSLLALGIRPPLALGAVVVAGFAFFTALPTVPRRRTKTSGSMSPASRSRPR